jgi:hypothetical protein
MSECHCLCEKREENRREQKRWEPVICKSGVLLLYRGFGTMNKMAKMDKMTKLAILREEASELERQRIGK